MTTSLIIILNSSPYHTIHSSNTHNNNMNHDHTTISLPLLTRCCWFDASRLLNLSGLFLWTRDGSCTRSPHRTHAQLIRDGAQTHGNAKACLHRIVLLAIVVGVKELLEPLQELEIVLEPTLDQLVHWDYLIRDDGSTPL